MIISTIALGHLQNWIADKLTETDKGFALLEAALEQVQNRILENAPKKRENAHKLKNINPRN
ncbi:MAG: hypothetical protein JKY46_04605 [Robiginitomaculum sp.]|nr:hypothetical protein [Robiginitomaculum sp.]